MAGEVYALLEAVESPLIRAAIAISRWMTWGRFDLGAVRVRIQYIEGAHLRSEAWDGRQQDLP